MVSVSVDPAPFVAREDVSVIPATAGGVAPVARTVTGVVSASVTDGLLVAPGMFCSVMMMLAAPAFGCAVTTPFASTLATVVSVERKVVTPFTVTGLPGASGLHGVAAGPGQLPSNAVTVRVCVPPCASVTACGSSLTAKKFEICNTSVILSLLLQATKTMATARRHSFFIGLILRGEGTVGW